MSDPKKPDNLSEATTLDDVAAILGPPPPGLLAGSPNSEEAEPAPTKPTHESVAAAWAALVGKENAEVQVNIGPEGVRVFLESFWVGFAGERDHTAPTYDEALAKAAAEIARVVERYGSDDSDSDGGAECGQCFTCLDDPSKGLQNPTKVRFIVCPNCGNKRCPKATHHDHACTGSNEPGQPGSRYRGGEE